MGAYANPMGGGIGDAPSNQYFKNLPGFANPGQSQYTATGAKASASAPNPYQVPNQSNTGMYPGGGSTATFESHDIGHGIVATGLQFPGLSQDTANWLLSQLGQGMKPYNLGVPLPGGGSARRGQLTAGLNPLLAQLLNFYSSGGQKNSFLMPGLSTMENVANNGISALPMWQQMIQAQQQDISQNEAALREQFGSMGDLAGSPFGTAMSNYMEQTTKDQNALLGQLQLQGILQGQIPAASDLMSMFNTGATNMASGIQALDQQAIQNQYQEFLRTQPQNNPTLQDLMAMATMYPPTTKTPTAFQTATQFLGALSGAGGQTSSGAGFTF